MLGKCILFLVKYLWTSVPTKYPVNFENTALVRGLGCL